MKRKKSTNISKTDRKLLTLADVNVNAHPHHNSIRYGNYLLQEKCSKRCAHRRHTLFVGCIAPHANVSESAFQMIHIIFTIKYMHRHECVRICGDNIIVAIPIFILFICFGFSIYFVHFRLLLWYL